MNILMLSNTYYPIMGGLEKSIATFAEAFRKMGHKVLIVVPEYKRAKKDEFGVVRVPAIRNFNQTDFSVNLPIPGLVSKILDAFKADIVHAHHPFLMGDTAMRLAGQYGIPLVFTHHTLFEEYTEYFPLNTEAGRNFIMELATGYANLADHVVAPSESVREILIERGVKAPVTVVPTGVNTEFFKKGKGETFRREMKIPQNVFVAGYTGRVSPEKNMEFLAKAAADWMEKEKKAWFLVVGEGDSVPALKKFFRARKLTRRVRFAGVQKGKKLVRAYHALDVFAFASQSETQGMVITEAMAAGVPVVALDGPGIRDCVRDRENGMLVEKKTPKALARALREFMAQPAAAKKKMKEEALKTAEAFSVEHCAQKMIRDVYTAARAGKPRAREEASPWHETLNRIRTEWEMLKNLGKATGTALVDMAIGPTEEKHDH